MRQIALLAALLLLLENRPVAGASGNPATPGAPFDLVAVEGDTATVRADFSRKLAPWIAHNQFDELDKMASDLRASKAQTALGLWHLLVFYDELAELADTAPDQEWASRLKFFNRWMTVKPKSITARVGLARCYKEYAWHARGYGTADTVREADEQTFQGRLTQAAQVLREAKSLEAKCPVWWDTMHFVALGQGWPLANYNRMFEEAVAFEPNYIFFYNNKAIFLLPRWYGQEGDWQKFARESADKAGGQAGDILYARMGWRVHERRIYDAFLSEGGYSWPRMQKGLAAIVKNYPDSLTPASELAYLSYQAGDAAVAKPLIDRIGNRLDTEVWGDDNEKFLRAKTWANGGRPAAPHTSVPGK